MATPHYRALVRTTPSPPTVVHLDYAAPCFCPCCGYCLSHAHVLAYPVHDHFDPSSPAASLICWNCVNTFPEDARLAAIALHDPELHDFTLSRGNILALAPPRPEHRGRTARELLHALTYGVYPGDPDTDHRPPPQLQLPYEYTTAPHRQQTGTDEQPAHEPPPPAPDWPP